MALVVTYLSKILSCSAARSIFKICPLTFMIIEVKSEVVILATPKQEVE